jgi:serine/threonine-protein kinase
MPNEPNLPPTAPFPDGPERPGTTRAGAARPPADGPVSAPGARALSGGAPSHADRLELAEEIGRGGMGAVVRGFDPLLNRPLAVKVLLDEHRNDPRLLERFIEEAQVTGQLQHPSVVPVHELGVLPDGRPFFTMKLVRGRTLAELLAERADPTQNLPRFVQIFEHMAQALAYAHSKGVVHRDLKPANVMVGAFGEVQVMDWGLAKVLTDGPAQEIIPPAAPTPSVITTVRTQEGGSVTEAGSALGTYAYMPPEQALGERARLDRRADVFGLGAVLCEILTGEPPYTGQVLDVVKLRALGAELGPAFERLDHSRAGPELIHLAKACLTADPAGRPADAAAVATAVAAYQVGVAERLRQAELTAAAEHVAAVGERKLRRLQLVMGGVALAAVVTAAGGALWVQRERAARSAEADRLRAEAEERVAVTAAHARSLSDRGQQAEALAAARQAVELADDARVGAAVRGQAERLLGGLTEAATAAERDRRLLDRLLEVRGPQEERTGTPASEAADSTGATTDALFAEAFREYGLDVDTDPEAGVAARLSGRPAGVRAEVTAALDDWAAVRRARPVPGDWQRLARLARAVDPEPEDGLRAEMRAVLERDRLAAERRAGDAAWALLPLAALADLAPGADRGRLRALAAAADVHRLPALTLRLLAQALQQAGDGPRAVDLLRAARRARPADVLLCDLLGRLLAQQAPPRWAEAIACFEAERALRPELGIVLAAALLQSGRPAEGLALLEEMRRQQPENPVVPMQYGWALQEQGRPAEAEAAYRRAVALGPGRGGGYTGLGIALYRQGRTADAVAALRRAAELLQG